MKWNFTSFCRPSVILLIHLVEDGNRLRVVLLKSGSLQTLSDIRCLADLKASRKINILLNEKVFEEIVPERTETLETTKDTIEVKINSQTAIILFTILTWPKLSSLGKRQDLSGAPWLKTNVAAQTNPNDSRHPWLVSSYNTCLGKTKF